MERWEWFKMKSELGRINDNLDIANKTDLKKQKVDIDSPVKTGKEANLKKIDKSDIWKNTREKISDIVNRPVEIPRKFYSSYGDRLKMVPEKNGEWTGRPGESVFKSNKPEIREALTEYGIEGIKYKDGVPDFSPITDTSVNINMDTNRPSNFKKADAACAEKWNKDNRDGRNDWNPRDVTKWRKDNDYTWHERSDCKTCQLIPREIHDAHSHTGGCFECGIRDQQKENKITYKTQEGIEFEAQEAWDMEHPDWYSYDDYEEVYDPVWNELDDD